jgi:hypothetical protein
MDARGLTCTTEPVGAAEGYEAAIAVCQTGRTCRFCCRCAPDRGTSHAATPSAEAACSTGDDALLAGGRGRPACRRWAATRHYSATLAETSKEHRSRRHGPAQDLLERGLPAKRPANPASFQRLHRRLRGQASFQQDGNGLTSCTIPRGYCLPGDQQDGMSNTAGDRAAIREPHHPPPPIRNLLRISQVVRGGLLPMRFQRGPC